jgi:hypothetical protein
MECAGRNIKGGDGQLNAPAGILKGSMEHHIRKEEMASSRNEAGIEQESSRNCELRFI